jgi:hypothetical protein
MCRNCSTRCRTCKRNALFELGFSKLQIVLNSGANVATTATTKARVDQTLCPHALCTLLTCVCVSHMYILLFAHVRAL